MSVQGLSRVHALILQIDGTPYVIDTASTYGIRVQDMPVRVHSLKAGEDVLLSRGLAVVRWRRVH